jgi:hypothetical protein
MQWIRVDQVDRRIVIHPIVARSAQAADREAVRAGGQGRELGEESAGSPAPNEALLQALADIGVENPKRGQLAGLDIDPLWVQAWQLWAQHPHRRTLTNPVGNIIRKLESGERPPHEFLRAAEQEIRLRQWTQQQEPVDRGEDPEAQEKLDLEDDDLFAEARRIWARSLEDLKLQMTRATFDTWLRGSKVVGAGDGSLTIAVRHVHAVDWLQNRLLPLIERTVARHADSESKITFVACT